MTLFDPWDDNEENSKEKKLTQQQLKPRLK